jgi:hypothetical protein
MPPPVMPPPVMPPPVMPPVIPVVPVDPLLPAEFPSLSPPDVQFQLTPEQVQVAIP